MSLFPDISQDAHDVQYVVKFGQFLQEAAKSQ